METPSMIGYIQDQGRALKATFENRAVYCNPFCQIFQERDIRKIYLLGSGTSYNAATAIKQYLEMYLPVEAEVMIPTVFTNHAKINRNCIYNQDEILVVGISQSGTSVSTIEAMKKAKQEGYYTVAITEATESLITKEVDRVVKLTCGKEEIPVETRANAPIGTGPYVMTEFVPGEKAVLTAWADYPGQKASIETITFKAIAEPSAAYIAVEAGDADFTEIDATDYARAEANDNLVFYTGDTTYTAFVAMNTQEPPFDNVNVRKAMAYAYNKEGYLNVKGENYHTIDSMFPMMSEYYYASDDAITYDLEKAKELLAAEGYDESNPLTFEIIGYSNNDVVMQAYQADLKSIGVNVELVTQEFGVFLENMVGMNFQMLTGGWGDTTGNPLTSAECYYSGSFGSQNISFYDNPVCDELYITAKTSNDTAEIKDACQQIQQIAWEDVPMFPTFGRNEGYVYNKNLNGVVISPSGTLSFRTATLG